MSIKRLFPKISLGTVGWILVLGFVGYRAWPQLAAGLGVGTAGAEAPNIRVETLSGETFTLADLRGKVVLVNFWATWCPPCRMEMPGFQKVYEEKRDEGFVIVGLSTDVGGRRAVQEFLDEHGITYPVGMASLEARQAFGGIRALPTSFLVDRHGRIRHQVQGMFTSLALGQAVERLLAEDGPVAQASAGEVGHD